MSESRDPSRILILEGVEGSGKSTLREALEALGWGGVHFSYSTASDRVAEWMQEIRAAAGRSRDGRVVVDRLHPSCVVYETRTRGAPTISEFDRWVLEGWLQARSAVLYLLRCRDEAEAQRRLDIKYEGWLKCWEVYHALDEECTRSTLPITYDPYGKWLLATGISSAEAAASVVDAMLVPEASVAQEGMGARRPGYWLVGEQRNPRAQGSRYQATFGGGSGEYLYRACKVVGLTWDQLHVSNARIPKDSDEPWDLHEHYEELGYPKQVVALGAVAEEALRSAGVPHRRVDHPQYARRFRRHQLFEYARELAWAANLEVKG